MRLPSLSQEQRVRLNRFLAEADHTFEVARFEADASKQQVLKETAAEMDPLLASIGPVAGIEDPAVKLGQMRLQEVEQDLRDAALECAVCRYDALASVYLDALRPDWTRCLELLDSIGDEARSIEPQVTDTQGWVRISPVLRSKWKAQVKDEEEQWIGANIQTVGSHGPDFVRQARKLNGFLERHPKVLQEEIYLARNR